ncbi:hypothetical protein H072_247 [Dactylellina haptotyla CBS 200.50]|uniref:Uncharacterized protein n=1 Tax=Dactylellina haptotyla (strain CBS 200.50) TaxID=1284197 RepID=S8C1V2_DACHA|nr:hypothetical protein H072_247 [Dactylellina haptotyla CBS 200.50]
MKVFNLTLLFLTTGVLALPGSRPVLKERAVQPHTAGCRRDNCLRAVFARSTAASAFCATFTTAAVTATTSLGPWQTQCNGSPSRVSSACSCVVPRAPLAS